MTTPVYGYQGQLGIDTANPVTRRFDFQSAGLAMLEEFKDTNGLRGTRGRSGERVVAGIRRVAGPIALQPTSLELSYLLQWILGGTPTGSGTVTYPLADTLPSRYVTIDAAAKVLTYNGCVVDRCRIRGAQGEPVTVTLDVVGVDEAVANAGTFPALSLDVTTQPFMFFELVVTVGGTAYLFREVDVLIDNAIDRDRFFNSQTATALIPTDRHVSMDLSAPYGDAAALYGMGAAGAAVVAAFTNGSAVWTSTFGRVAFPRRSPGVPGRQEIMLPLHGTAYKSGSTAELVTTLAVGP